jgi:hypothetical protein
MAELGTEAFRRRHPMAPEDLPVCDGGSWSLDRSFAIYQLAPGAEAPTIAAEVKDYATVFDDAGQWLEDTQPAQRVPRATLILPLEYSEETAAKARALLEAWMTPSMTTAEMNAVIGDTLGVEHW